MPFVYGLFYSGYEYEYDGYKRVTLYDEDRPSMLKDVKEITSTITGDYKESVIEPKDRPCSFSLLIYGDYNCDGVMTGTPCPIEALGGFCWQNIGNYCK